MTHSIIQQRDMTRMNYFKFHAFGLLLLMDPRSLLNSHVPHKPEFCG